MAKETQNTEESFKLPTTKEEFDKYMEQVKKEAYDKAASEVTEQHQKVIGDLESKIALIENNPLQFPRLETADGVVELQMLNSFSVSDDNKVIMYDYEDFTKDEVAEKKFGKKAKEVLEDLHELAPDLFHKIN